MLKAKDKEARRGNLITFAIVLALTLVTMVLENVMSPGSLLFTVIKKGAVYSLVAVSMNLLNGFTGLFSLGLHAPRRVCLCDLHDPGRRA